MGHILVRNSQRATYSDFIIYVTGVVTISLACLITSNHAYAESSQWTTTMSVDSLMGSYSDKTLKQDLMAFGITTSIQYLDSHRFSFGYNSTSIQYDPDIVAESNLSQSTLQFDATTAIYSDLLNGKLSPSFQYQRIGGDLSDPLLGDMSTFGVIVRYINFRQTLYLDAHFSNSSYDTDISVTQQDIAIGRRFFGPSHWIQLRLYSIGSSSLSEANNSVDFLYKYWLTTYSLMAPHSVHIAVLLGDRQFAVDPDSQSVWNLNEKHTQYIRTGADWLIMGKLTFTTLFSLSSYEPTDGTDSYNNIGLYFKLDKTF